MNVDKETRKKIKQERDYMKSLLLLTGISKKEATTIANILFSMGIVSVGDLRKHPLMEVKNSRNIGVKREKALRSFYEIFDINTERFNDIMQARIASKHDVMN